MIFVFVVSFASCSKEEGDHSKIQKLFSIQLTEKSVSSNPTLFTLNVQSNCNWKIELDADWISISPLDTIYHDSLTLSIMVEANAKMESRIAKVYFRYDDNYEILTITQAAFNAYLDISLSEIFFFFFFFFFYIRLFIYFFFFANSSDSWISIKPSTGLIGNFDMNINVETNNTPNIRTGEIHFWNLVYGIERYVSIRQEGIEQMNNSNYVDEYGVDWGEGETIQGLTWAPVNCGYEDNTYPLGKLYQWGRKFGLGYSGAECQDIVST